MAQAPNTSKAIIAAAVITLIGSVSIELIKTLKEDPQPVGENTSQVSIPKPVTETSKSPAAQSVTRALPIFAENPNSKTPRLDSEWYIETYHKSSSYKAYVGMRVRYKVHLSQEGQEISISGNKIGEVYQGIEKTYSSENRTGISLAGELELQDGEWVIRFKGEEESKTKPPMNIVANLSLAPDSKGLLGLGDFSASSASAAGPAVWTAASLWKHSKWRAGEEYLLSQ